ncbi:MAG: hypothetical protein GY862_35415 [Gammaproteobacteria bacterium]|nr:hypothetical protein [Gammaproteobacteria bacterium]
MLDALRFFDDKTNQFYNIISFLEGEGGVIQSQEWRFTYFGKTTGVQFIAASFRKYYKEFNLDAWKHVVALTKEKFVQNGYKGSFVQIDFDTVLIWKKNSWGQHIFEILK